MTPTLPTDHAFPLAHAVFGAEPHISPSLQNSITPTLTSIEESLHYGAVTSIIESCFFSLTIFSLLVTMCALLGRGPDLSTLELLGLKSFALPALRPPTSDPCHLRDPPYQELFDLTSPSLTTASYSSYSLKASLPSLPPIFHSIEVSGCLGPSALPECGQALAVFTRSLIQPGHAVPPSVHLLPIHSAHHPSDTAA